MKKSCSAIMILLMLMLIGCSSKRGTEENAADIVVTEQSSEAFIEELNDNSNFGLALNQASGLSENEARQYHADQPYVITVEDQLTKYYCFRYPDVDAPLAITQIHILDQEYDVFGVHIGDDIEDGIAILCDYGYQEMDYPVEDTCQYAKGDVHVILEYEQEKITGIVVSLYADTENNFKY